MKVELKDIDINLIENVCEKCGTKPEIDDDGYIEVDTILAILDELDEKCIELEERIEGLEESIRDGHPDTYFDFSKKVQSLIAVLEKQSNFIKEKGLEEEYGKYNY